MSFAWLPCVIFCLSACKACARNRQSSPHLHGHLRRVKDGGMLNDTAYFTFKQEPQARHVGKASYSIAEIKDENGKLIYEQRPYNSVRGISRRQFTSLVRARRIPPTPSRASWWK